MTILLGSSFYVSESCLAVGLPFRGRASWLLFLFMSLWPVNCMSWFVAFLLDVIGRLCSVIVVLPNIFFTIFFDMLYVHLPVLYGKINMGYITLHKTFIKVVFLFLQMKKKS